MAEVTDIALVSEPLLGSGTQENARRVKSRCVKFISERLKYVRNIWALSMRRLQAMGGFEELLRWRVNEV